MIMPNTVPKQTGDNVNQPGIGPNKGDLKPGDITWVTPPPNMAEKGGRLVPDGPENAVPKNLSGSQKRDLAKRIKAKLRLAAAKRH
jgi:hypothetical protein